MLRVLTETTWEGGGGYSIAEVSKMTPDQIYFRLCNKDYLRREGVALSTEAAVRLTDQDGFVKGRDIDGREIKRKLSHEGGLSHLQWLKIQAKKEEPKPQRRRRRGS